MSYICSRCGEEYTFNEGSNYMYLPIEIKPLRKNFWFTPMLEKELSKIYCCGFYNLCMACSVDFLNMFKDFIGEERKC